MLRFFFVLCCMVSGAGLTACGGGSGNNGIGTANTSGYAGAAGLAACTAGTALFTTPPVALSTITGWEPLGHVAPSAHTFPTDHQYLYVSNPESPLAPTVSVPLVAPGDMRVVLITKSSSGPSGLVDYAIYFQPCADVAGWFGHVGNLSGPLASYANSIAQRCSTYEPTPGLPVTRCESSSLSIDVRAGTQIGTAGDGGSRALDWGLQDRRIAPLRFTNPSRFQSNSGFDTFHTVPASAYFSESMERQIALKVGRFDGSIKRTVLPLGGSIDVDVDGTARGYWFNPAQAYPPESYHASLAPDYYQPDREQVFSLGVSQLFQGAALQSFRIRTTGTVNRAFETITPDGQLYCYEFLGETFFGNSRNVILLQLVDAATLKIEVRNVYTSCAAAAPYTFTATAVTYKR